MFDIDSGKLLIVAVLALIVIGPKELPRVMRQVGQSIGKLRRMASEFQGQFMDAMKEADLADIRKELDELNKTAALDLHFDPVSDVKSELMVAMEPATVSTAPTPAAGFELPAAIEGVELGSIGAGVAPLGELQVAEETSPALDQPEETGLNGAAVHIEATAPPKRKILVKRRTSRLNIVQAQAVAQRTGEPLIVRRCPVRTKAIQDAVSPA